jgi:hypothetical protein
MENVSAERAKALAAELAQLHDLQLEAIKTATFIPMSPDEWQLYEARGTRGAEINRLLGNIPP